jgi:hypothetical protein
VTHISPATKSGWIAYRAADGRSVGRERFELVTHGGGHVLRAMCEMDEIGLLRDVTIATDADWRPLDGFCRLTRAGAVIATHWFTVGGTSVDVATQAGGGGMTVQRVETDDRVPYLGLHPLQGDALIVEARGMHAIGEYLPVAAVTNSISPNGDEAPGAQMMAIEVAYLGIEPIRVAAGDFAARRYALRWRVDWPPADLWVRERDCVFLCMRWPLIETWYELERLDE